MRLGDNEMFAFAESAEHPDMPPVEGCIRLFYFARIGMKQIGNDLIYTEYSIMNLGGYMPPRLLNMTLSTENRKNFVGMKKYFDS